MSFSTEIKQEISYNQLKKCCLKAELAALILMSESKIIDRGFTVKTENPTISKRVLQLIKDAYNASTKLTIHKKNNLKKNNVYELFIIDKEKMILNDLQIINENTEFLVHPKKHIVFKECCARAYLAGAFLTRGFCSDAKSKTYHLEIVTGNSESSAFLLSLMERFDLFGKTTTRRGKEYIYLKKADQISDFLKCVGAQESMMNFEEIRIDRDFIISQQRQDNCDIANQVKTLNTAKSQLLDIGIIYDYDKYDDLDQKLRDVIDLRLEYQENSLLELCDIYYRKTGSVISKSGIKHRFNKIHSIATALIEQNY